MGGRSCTCLGCPGGRADDSPMARIPVPPWAGNPVGSATGIPVRSEEGLPSLSLGIWFLPLHQHKKMMGKNKHKGALLRWLQCQRISHKKPGWLSINPPDSPQDPTTVLHPASSQDRQEQAALPRPPPWPPNWGNKNKLNKTSTTPQQSPRKRKISLGISLPL